jgi:hypothetical protein
MIVNELPTGYGRISEHCPRCQGAVVRVPRRVIDRVVSLISPRHRYRCQSIGCGWEGNLPAKR